MPQQTVLPRTPPHQDRPLDRLHVWQIQAVRDVLFVVTIIFLIWLGYVMRAVTVPLLVALLLAYLFEPLVSSLTARMKTSRSVVVGGLLVSVSVGVLLLLVITVPLIIGQTARLVQDVRGGRFQHSILKLREVVPPEYQADYERAVQWLMPGIEVPPATTQPADLPPDPALAAPDRIDDEARLRELIREEIAAQRDDVATFEASSASLWDLARSGGRTMFGIIGAIVELGLLAFLIPFYFFFFSVSFPTVVNFGRDMIPVANRPRALAMISKMDRAVAGFVRGRIVICLIMGAMLALGWFIVGVPYSIVLGLVVGAFCLVPYLGGVGVPLAIGLLTFSQLQLAPAERMPWWGVILWPTLVFVIVQIVENYILTPVIAGKATNLDPVTILVAVLAGGSIGGVYGMILAIPVAACLKIAFTDLLLPKIRAWTRGEAADPLPLQE